MWFGVTSSRDVEKKPSELCPPNTSVWKLSCGPGSVDEVHGDMEVVLYVEEVHVDMVEDEDVLHEDRLGKTGPQEHEKEQGSTAPHWLYRKQTSPCRPQ